MATNPSAFGNAPTGPAGGSLTGTYPNPTLGNSLSWQPSDAGYLAWTYDPALAQGSAVLTAGTVFLIGVQVRAPISVTNVTFIITVAGATLTAAENFAGLYNSAGTRLAVTADQTTNWASANNTPMALVGGPFQLAAGFYWVAGLSNGTTGPTLAAGSGTFRASNLGTAVAVARYASNGTGTALPASITPASNALTSPAYWAGLS